MTPTGSDPANEDDLVCSFICTRSRVRARKFIFAHIFAHLRNLCTCEKYESNSKRKGFASRSRRALFCPFIGTRSWDIHQKVDMRIFELKKRIHKHATTVLAVPTDPRVSLQGSQGLIGLKTSLLRIWENFFGPRYESPNFALLKFKSRTSGCFWGMRWPWPHFQVHQRWH